MGGGFPSPELAEAAFYRAFETLDGELMERVWCDLPETACVHPGGDLQRGRTAVIGGWVELFASARRPSVRYRTLQHSVSGELAVHLVEEFIRPGDAPDIEASRVLATNVFRLGPDGWRLLTHHASLPVMRRPQSERSHLH